MTPLYNPRRISIAIAACLYYHANCLAFTLLLQQTNRQALTTTRLNTGNINVSQDRYHQQCCEKSRQRLGFSQSVGFIRSKIKRIALYASFQDNNDQDTKSADNDISSNDNQHGNSNNASKNNPQPHTTNHKNNEINTITNDDNDNDDDSYYDPLLKQELQRWQSLQDFVAELEREGYDFEAENDKDTDFDSDNNSTSADHGDNFAIWEIDDDDDDEDFIDLWDDDTSADHFAYDDDESSIEEPGSKDYKVMNDDDPVVKDDSLKDARLKTAFPNTSVIGRPSGLAALENALLQGVVPVSAGVGSDCLPGDYGFDPLKLASKDYFQHVQVFLLNLLPPSPLLSSIDMEQQKQQQNSNNNSSNNNDKITDTIPKLEFRKRPKALVLRDYREAEIRHGRLAMLAAVIWPLQELLDQLLLDEDQFGPLIYGPITLPYFPLFMTAVMLLLGYLDIYSQAIKDRDQLGEAFLPGDCFWDPLSILGTAAPDRMKRNMQERELLNGRAGMLAVLVYLWEEGWTQQALIDIPGNELLLKPAYQVPFIQRWLDEQFAFSAGKDSIDAASSVLDAPITDAVVSNFMLLLKQIDIVLDKIF